MCVRVYTCIQLLTHDCCNRCTTNDYNNDGGARTHVRWSVEANSEDRMVVSCVVYVDDRVAMLSRTAELVRLRPHHLHYTRRKQKTSYTVESFRSPQLKWRENQTNNRSMLTITNPATTD